MEGQRLLTHCRHFELIEADPSDEDDVPMANIVCDCGWWRGPVQRVGAWKTQLINLFRAHVDEAKAGLPA